MLFDPQDPQRQPEEGFGTSLLLAPVRGVAGAAAGVANLFGAGVEDNFGLGHSQGFIPGLVEGVTQFAAGFVPGAGILSKVGAFSKLGRYASIARGVTAGAIADFTVFDGNDPRLSNLIQSVPALQNPITEFLASKPDDSEVLGRFKNVLEGAGLGAITDGLLHMFKGMRKANAHIASGDHASAKAAQDEVSKAAEDIFSQPTDKELRVQEMLDPANIDKPLPEDAAVIDVEAAKAKFDAKGKSAEEPIAPAAEVITPTDLQSKAGLSPNGTVVVSLGKDGNLGFANFESFVREPKSRVTVTQLKDDAKILNGSSKDAAAIAGEKPFGMRAEEWRTKVAEEAKKRGYDAVSFPGLKGQREVHILNEDAVTKRFDVGPDPSKSFWDILKQREQTDIPKIVADSELETYARRMKITPEKVQEIANAFGELRYSPERAKEKIAGIANFEKMGEAENAAFQNYLVDRLSLKLEKPTTQSWEQLGQEANKEVARLLNMDPAVIAAEDMAAAKNIDRYGQVAAAKRVLLDIKGKAIGDMLLKYRMASPEAKAILANQLGIQFEGFGLVYKGYGRVRGSFGRGLQTFRRGAADLEKNMGALSELIAKSNKKWGMKAIDQAAELVAKYGAEAGMKMLMAPTRMDRFVSATLDYYMFSLLSAPKTLTTNIVGSFMTGIYRPMERSLGAWVGKKLLDPSRAKEFERAIQKDWNIVGNIASATSDMFLLRGKATGTAADAISGFKGSFKAGDSLSTPGLSPIEGFNQAGGLTPENIGAIIGKKIDPSQGAGRALKAVLDATHLPSKILAGSDEAARRLFQQSHFKGELQMQARELGLEGVDAENWINAKMAESFKNGQLVTEDLLRSEAEKLYPPGERVDEANRLAHIDAYVEKGLADNGVKDRFKHLTAAQDFSLEATFQTKLEPGRGIISDLGQALQGLKERHPLLTLFAPFIRTPLNILAFAADRMPIPGLNKDFVPMVQYLGAKFKLLPERLGGAGNSFAAKLMSSDPEVAADAIGRSTVAIGMLGILGSAAAAGAITGKGPEDPEQLKVLKATGWQPYSIKVGDSYVSYQRLDPFASIMSFYADVGDIARYSPESSGVTDLMMGAFAATVTNLESKSYLAGVTDLFKLLADPVNQMPKVGGRLLGSAVPNVFAAARDFTDPYIADMHGMLDRVKARVPFLSGGMDKQRNVLGEPLNRSAFKGALATGEGIASYMFPVQFSTTTSDIVSNELADLAYPFSPPKPIRMGLDLRDFKNEAGQTAYDRWQELTAEVKLDGRTVRSSLERLIKSNRYQAMPREGIEKLGLDSPQISLIKQTLSRYQREAERKMLLEFPDIRQQTRDRRALQAAVNAGADPSSLENLLNAAGR